jgi:hypothetical protein
LLYIDIIAYKKKLITNNQKHQILQITTMADKPYCDEIVVQIRNALANNSRIAVISDAYYDQIHDLFTYLMAYGTIDTNEWKIFNGDPVDTIERCCKEFNFNGNIIIDGSLADTDVIEEHHYHIIEITQPLF